jgi:hypothetical protein
MPRVLAPLVLLALALPAAGQSPGGKGAAASAAPAPAAAAPAAATPAAATPAAATREHRGTTFAVRYPAGFTARGVEEDGQEGTAAAFRAPDGSVEFYVYSPLWTGEPAYARLAEGEVEVSRAVETPRPGRRVERVTVRSKDGSSLRSWEDVQEEDAANASRTRRVFGLRYRDAQALARHREAYLAFKRSLQQFAD